MIDPSEIARKAEKLYPKAVTAILSGSVDFFPNRLACNLKPPSDHAELIREVERLRQGSKASVGYGYTVNYQLRRSYQHGSNDFPESVYIETMEDLVRLARKTGEYRDLMKAVALIRRSLPELEQWLRSHWRRLLDALTDVPALIGVTRWLIQHPRPDCFPRELPLQISSKLIESHWPLLATWWDILLTPESIDYGCDPKNYAQRYGFRWPQPHLLIRLLDRDLKETLGVPFVEFSLPIKELAAWIYQADQLRSVIIVENKTNLLTFPATDKSIALGGLGFGASNLSRVPWLHRVAVNYWGDLDVEGFRILSLVRSIFPQTQSFLMDLGTLIELEALAVPGNAAIATPPLHLTIPEREAFCYCSQRNLRLEQERIPQSYIASQAANFGTLGSGVVAND